MPGKSNTVNVSKFKSRKLWVTVLTAAVVSLANQMGLENANVDQLVHLVIAYLIAQGSHDVATKLNSKA